MSAETFDVSQTLDHLFRHESGKMVAILTRIFGIEHLTLVEDVVQEALARAVQTWPFYGVPNNPSAWILRASRNLALDVVRRQKVFRDKEAEIVRLMDQPERATNEVSFAGDEFADDTLKLMFVCCHPSLAAEAQISLALNTLCGFSVAEIGRAFLTSEAAIAKRLTRAKQKIREARLRFEIPEGQELLQRVDAVLQSIYLLFNEGYKASSGDALVRADLCHEAIRLGGLLSKHPAGDTPRTHALLALMLLNAARLPARVHDDGTLLRLQEQDRSLWDQGMIARGMYHFTRSASGHALSEFHLQAGIVACHCASKDYDATDWPRILGLYDELVAMAPSPVIFLNRAIVVANVHGPDAGLAAVAAIKAVEPLQAYHLYHAVLGELELRRQRAAIAVGHFEQAHALATIPSEREFLEKRLAECRRNAESRHAPA
ncbi:MAG TPA: DUF6596 domain-containing protein [Verrucomicrobiae bacterium]|nr:DUF6596 domain-containing protein [Verrucomicrobiae bacterium]